MLVQHAGLNPMGRGIPRAGCPAVNLRRTLRDLVVDAGFSVVVCEEVPELYSYGTRTKGRIKENDRNSPIQNRVVQRCLQPFLLKPDSVCPARSPEDHGPLVRPVILQSAAPTGLLSSAYPVLVDLRGVKGIRRKERSLTNGRDPPRRYQL